jgi:hypothetical protein
MDKPNKIKDVFGITYLIGCSSVEETIAWIK